VLGVVRDLKGTMCNRRPLVVPDRFCITVRKVVLMSMVAYARVRAQLECFNALQRNLPVIAVNCKLSR